VPPTGNSCGPRSPVPWTFAGTLLEAAFKPVPVLLRVFLQRITISPTGTIAHLDLDGRTVAATNITPTAASASTLGTKVNGSSAAAAHSPRSATPDESA
jgi:hypothetical protein